jgi:hypothetical protein
MPPVSMVVYFDLMWYACTLVTFAMNIHNVFVECGSIIHRRHHTIALTAPKHAWMLGQSIYKVFVLMLNWRAFLPNHAKPFYMHQMLLSPRGCMQETQDYVTIFFCALLFFGCYKLSITVLDFYGKLSVKFALNHSWASSCCSLARLY